MISVNIKKPATNAGFFQYKVQVFNLFHVVDDGLTKFRAT